MLCLTLNVWGPNLTRSISWLLMPWLLASPEHQQPWYWLEQVGPCLTWERTSNTCVISMWRNDMKCKYMFMFALKKLAYKGLKFHWSLLPGGHHQFRKWLGAEEATSHYLNPIWTGPILSIFQSFICKTYTPSWYPPVGAGLGSRISPHHHWVVAEVHWRGAQGWRSIFWVVATFNHVGRAFNLSMAATGDIWIIPSFRIWGYVLHVEHISCVITNCDQLQWAIPSLFSIALGLAGEKHYQKITIPIFRLVLQNFAIPGYFSYILFYCFLFYLLSSDWIVIAVCGSISVRELVKS